MRRFVMCVRLTHSPLVRALFDRDKFVCPTKKLRCIREELNLAEHGFVVLPLFKIGQIVAHSRR
jgi:hypothetical protein